MLEKNDRRKSSDHLIRHETSDRFSFIFRLFSSISFVCQCHIFSSNLYRSADATRWDAVREPRIFVTGDTGGNNFKI